MNRNIFNIKNITKIFLVTFIFSNWFIGSACSEGRKIVPSTPEEVAAMTKIIDEELQDYQSMNLFPGTTRLMSSKSGRSAPHGRWVTIYANDLAFYAVNSGASKLPDGSLVIKDAFSTEKILRATIIMKKVNGEWNYGAPYINNPAKRKYGNPKSLAVASCVTCHLKAEKDNLHAWK